MKKLYFSHYPGFKAIILIVITSQLPACLTLPPEVIAELKPDRHQPNHYQNLDDDLKKADAR